MLDEFYHERLVQAVARCALGAVSETRQSPVEERSKELQAGLYNALVVQPEPDWGELNELISTSGLPENLVIDEVLPALSARLGQAWCDSQADFVQVTIGMSRLQRLLRCLTASRASAPCAQEQTDCVLVVTPECEPHTFGALIVTDQLRRAGAHVCQMIARPARQVVEMLEHNEFDAIFVSCSNRRNADDLRHLFRALNQSRAASTKLVVGGAMKTREGERLSAELGADMFSTDAVAALRLCKRAIRVQD